MDSSKRPRLESDVPTKSLKRPQSSQRSASTKSFGLGLLGCGWFSRRAHIPALLKIERWSTKTNDFQVRIEAICSQSLQSCRSAARIMGRKTVMYQDRAKLLADPKIDIIIIALPIHLQAEAILAVLNAGKHAISEKPATASRPESAQIWDRLHNLTFLSRGSIPRTPVDSGLQHGVDGKHVHGRLAVLENWAYKPGVQHVMQMLRAGCIGSPSHYDMQLFRTLPEDIINKSWRTNAAKRYQGGHIRDVGVHLLRACRQWFGEIIAVKVLNWKERFSVHDEKSEQGTSFRAMVWHEDPGTGLKGGGIRGTIEIVFAPPLKEADARKRQDLLERQSGVEIYGINAQYRLHWQFSPSKVYGDFTTAWTAAFNARRQKRGKKGNKHTMRQQNIQHIQGDSWVTGGVRDALKDALKYCARPQVSQCHRCSVTEAFKDIAVIEGFLSSQKAGGEIKAIDNQFHLASIQQNEVGLRFNQSQTTCHRPRFEIYARGVSDLRQAVLRFRTLVQNSDSNKNSSKQCEHVDCGDDGQVKDKTDNDIHGKNAAMSTQNENSFAGDRMSSKDIVEGYAHACEEDSNIIRAVGTCHSWSNIGEAPGGLRVVTRLMDRVLWWRPLQTPAHTLSGSKKTARRICMSQATGVVGVEPGLLLRDLVEALKSRGQTLPSWPMLLHQTVAGAVSTGSHGSSMHHRTIADAVVGLVIITISGAVIEIREESDILKAARSSLGSTGIIVQIELATIPLYHVQRRVMAIPLKRLMNGNILTSIKQFSHQWVHWIIDGSNKESCGTSAPALVAVCLERVPPNSPNAQEYDGRNWFSRPKSNKISTHQAKEFSLHSESSEDQLDIWWRAGLPSLLVGGTNDQCDSESKLPLEGRNLITAAESKNDIMPEVSLQYSFPVAKCAQVACDLHSLSTSKVWPVAMRRIIEIKFLSGKHPLSMCAPNVQPPKAKEGYADTIVCFNILWRCRLDDPQLLAVEKIFNFHGGIPHLGKAHHLVKSMQMLDTSAATHKIGNVAPMYRPLDNPSFKLVTKRLASIAKPLVGISVMLPAYNAMPWLPIAIRDVLNQTGPIEIELIVVDDGSTDGTHDFLLALVTAMGVSGALGLIMSGSERASVPSQSNELSISDSKDPQRNQLSHPEIKALNPADIMAAREKADIFNEPGSIIPAAEKEIMNRPLSAEEVAASALPHHRLRVLWHPGRLNRGMGAAMSLALAEAKHELIGHMESDDERSCDSYERMLTEGLQAHPEWDAVCCRATCIGWDRPGMQRYVSWQNSLQSPRSMKDARFIEIPSLMQTGLFRRRAVETALAANGGCFRDDARWAVDSHFWLAFFAAGLQCGKLSGKPLFRWRQHPGQQTRRHGRLSISNLRRCKCEFLVGCSSNRGQVEIPPCAGHNVEVWSMGATLIGWVDDLRTALKASQKNYEDSAMPGSIIDDILFTNETMVASPPFKISGFEWKPGRPLPKGSFAATVRKRSKMGKKARRRRKKQMHENKTLKDASQCFATKEVAPNATSCHNSSTVEILTTSRAARMSRISANNPTGCECDGKRPIRLFAFGMAVARRRVRSQIADDWCPAHDYFVS